MLIFYVFQDLILYFRRYYDSIKEGLLLLYTHYFTSYLLFFLLAKLEMNNYFKEEKPNFLLQINHEFLIIKVFEVHQCLSWIYFLFKKYCKKSINVIISCLFFHNFKNYLKMNYFFIKFFHFL